jgi:hypothetical protein
MRLKRYLLWALKRACLGGVSLMGASYQMQQNIRNAWHPRDALVHHTPEASLLEPTQANVASGDGRLYKYKQIMFSHVISEPHVATCHFSLPRATNVALASCARLVKLDLTNDNAIS